MPKKIKELNRLFRRVAHTAAASKETVKNKIVGIDLNKIEFLLEAVKCGKTSKKPVIKKRHKRATVASTVKLMSLVFNELEAELSYYGVPDGQDIFTPFTLHKRVSDCRNIGLLAKALHQVVAHLEKTRETPGCPLCTGDWYDGRPDWCTIYGERDYWGEYDEDCNGPEYGMCAISHVLGTFGHSPRVYWNRLPMEDRV